MAVGHAIRCLQDRSAKQNGLLQTCKSRAEEKVEQQAVQHMRDDSAAGRC